MRHRGWPVVAVGLALAGCGDAGVDLNDLQARANRICERADSQVRALPKPRNAAATRASARRATAIMRRAIAALATLDPPAEARERYAQLLKNLRSGLAIANQRLDALLDRDWARVARVAERADQLTVANDGLARKIGVRECGSG